MGCCGRRSPTSTYQLSAQPLGQEQVSSAVVPTYRWRWSGLDGSVKVFDDELQARSYIEAGHPGTLTVVAG